MTKHIVSEANIHRLKTFVLLLSSDKDGEVLAAARAISNLLQKENRNWHDLAEKITSKEIAATKSRTRASEPQRKAKGKPKPPPKEAGRDMFEELLRASLSAWEREFVRSVYDQWMRGRSLSEKQRRCLERIVDTYLR